MAHTAMRCVITMLLCMTAAGATAVFTDTVADLGTIMEGDSATAVFTFANPGPDSLRLEEIRVGCNCITGPVRLTVLGPGQKDSIRATFISLGLNGPQSKEIFALFASPGDTAGETAAVRLVINAFVKCEVMFLPPSITGMIRPGASSFSAPGELMNTSGRTIHVVSLGSDPAAGLTISTGTLPAELQHGRKLPFTVTATPQPGNGQRGPIIARVIAVTTETRHPRHGCAVTIFDK